MPEASLRAEVSGVMIGFDEVQNRSFDKAQGLGTFGVVAEI